MKRKSDIYNVIDKEVSTELEQFLDGYFKLALQNVFNVDELFDYLYRNPKLPIDVKEYFAKSKDRLDKVIAIDYLAHQIHVDPSLCDKVFGGGSEEAKVILDYLSGEEIDNDVRKYNRGMFTTIKSDDGIVWLSKSKKPFIIAGYASIAQIDKEGHLIPVEALQEAFDKFMVHPEFRNIQLAHSDLQVGVVLPEWKDLKGKVYKSGVDDKGLYIVCMLRDDLNVMKKVKQEILAGNVRSFSIAGEALEKTLKTKFGRPYYHIPHLEFSEITLCLPGNEKIWTKTGLKEIKDIVAGDLVYTHFGRWKSVTKTFSRYVSEGLIKITTEHGSITATKEHPMRVLIYDGSVHCIWKPFAEVMVNELIPNPIPLKIASVKEIEEIQFDGLVYNLEVEDDNSYSAEFAVVHNCEEPVNQGSGFDILQKGYNITSKNAKQLDGAARSLTERSSTDLKSFLAKQQRPGLVPKRVQVHREGKVFERTQMVRPEEIGSPQPEKDIAPPHKTEAMREWERENFRPVKLHPVGDENVTEITGKTRKEMVDDIFSMAEDFYGKDNMENAPAGSAQKINEVLDFVDFYIKLATNSKSVSDVKLNGTARVLVKRLWNLAEKLSVHDLYKPILEKLMELIPELEHGDRHAKIIAIDSFIGISHRVEPTILPHTFEVHDLFRVPIQNYLVSIFNYLADDKSKMEKSFVEIRKSNRIKLLAKNKNDTASILETSGLTLEAFLTKQGKSPLIPKRVQVHRGGKVFERTQMVRPEETRKPKLDGGIKPIWQMSSSEFNQIRTEPSKTYDNFAEQIAQEMKEKGITYDKAGELDKFSPKARRLYQDMQNAREKKHQLLMVLRQQSKEAGGDPEMVMWDGLTDSAKLHQMSVIDALRSGKKVPQKVLEEYPEIKR